MQGSANWPPTFRPSQPTWAVGPTSIIAILLLLSPKADTHFNIPWIGGWKAEST